jgi:hypothetical protein
MVVIIEMDGFNVSRDFGANLDHVRFDGCVIGGFVTGIQNEPSRAAGKQNCPENRQDHETTLGPSRLSRTGL